MRGAPEVRRRLESDIQTIFARVLGRSDWVRDFMLDSNVSSDILMLSSPLSRASSFILDTEEVQEGRLSGSIKLRYLVVPAFSTLSGISGGAIVTSYAKRNHPLHQPSVMANTRIGRYIRDSTSGEWLMITRNESDNVTRIQWLHSARHTTRERICITCNTDLFNKGLFTESILFQCRDDEWRPCPTCHAPPERLCPCSSKNSILSSPVPLPKHPLDLPAVAAAALGEPKSEWFGRVQVSVFCNISRDLRGDVDACMQLRTSFEASQNANLVEQMQNLALAERARLILPRNVIRAIDPPVAEKENSHHYRYTNGNNAVATCDFENFLFGSDLSDNSPAPHAPEVEGENNQRLHCESLMSPQDIILPPCHLNTAETTAISSAVKHDGHRQRPHKAGVAASDVTMRNNNYNNNNINTPNSDMRHANNNSELLVSHHIFGHLENAPNLGSFARADADMLIEPFELANGNGNTNSYQSRQQQVQQQIPLGAHDDNKYNNHKEGDSFLLDGDDENNKNNYTTNSAPASIVKATNGVASVAALRNGNGPPGLNATSSPEYVNHYTNANGIGDGNHTNNSSSSIGNARANGVANAGNGAVSNASGNIGNNQGTGKMLPAPKLGGVEEDSIEDEGNLPGGSSTMPLARLEPRPPGMNLTPWVWHLRPYGPVGMATVLASGEEQKRIRRAEERRRKNRQAAARSNARAKEILLRKQGELSKNKKRVAELRRMYQLKTEENKKLRLQVFGTDATMI